MGRWPILCLHIWPINCDRCSWWLLIPDYPRVSNCRWPTCKTPKHATRQTLYNPFNSGNLREAQPNNYVKYCNCILWSALQVKYLKYQIFSQENIWFEIGWYILWNKVSRQFSHLPQEGIFKIVQHRWWLVLEYCIDFYWSNFYDCSCQVLCVWHSISFDYFGICMSILKWNWSGLKESCFLPVTLL